MPRASACVSPAKAKPARSAALPGDLYVVIFVREHEFFQRDGNDLHCTVPLAFTTLALGGEIKVPGIDGDETVKIPESTQTGTTFRLRGKGMPDVSGRGHGDLLVTVQAITPKKLTKEQKKLLEQLAATLPEQKVKPQRATKKTTAASSARSKISSDDARRSRLARATRAAREGSSMTPKSSSPAVLADFFPVAIQDLAERPLPPGGLWDPTFPPIPDPPPTPLHWNVCFNDAGERDRAADGDPATPARSRDRASSILPDEDWAARSQRSLTAVRAGRFIIAPPWDLPADDVDATVIVIEPSMGFGTGHHATTRMCLRLLSDIDVSDLTVLDLGTGSGVLSMAAALSGARSVIGIDVDQDAIDSAETSARLNTLPDTITFKVGDFQNRSAATCRSRAGQPHRRHVDLARPRHRLARPPWRPVDPQRLRSVGSDWRSARFRRIRRAAAPRRRPLGRGVVAPDLTASCPFCQSRRRCRHGTLLGDDARVRSALSPGLEPLGGRGGACRHGTTARAAAGVDDLAAIHEPARPGAIRARFG